MREHRQESSIFRFSLAAGLAAPLLRSIRGRIFFVYNWGRSKAVVVWGHVNEPEGAERRFRVGLRFVEIDENDRVRLLDFVRSKMVESMFDADKARRDGNSSSRLP